MAGDDPGGERGPFERFAGVEEEGANVLVVGTVPEGVHCGACRQLLGDADERVHRLVVLSGRAVASLDTRLPEGAGRDPEHLRVIDHEIPTRSAASPDSGGDFSPSDVAVERVPGDDLPELGSTIAETIGSFEALSGGLSTGELRMCFDSLMALVAEHGQTDVFGFLHILTERLDRTGAIATYHLPADRDAEVVTMLESLFDAVLELRVVDDTPEYRWDAESSGWLVLDG